MSIFEKTITSFLTWTINVNIIVYQFFLKIPMSNSKLTMILCNNIVHTTLYPKFSNILQRFLVDVFMQECLSVDAVLIKCMLSLMLIHLHLWFKSLMCIDININIICIDIYDMYICCDAIMNILTHFCLM